MDWWPWYLVIGAVIAALIMAFVLMKSPLKNFADAAAVAVAYIIITLVWPVILFMAIMDWARRRKWR